MPSHADAHETVFFTRHLTVNATEKSLTRFRRHHVGFVFQFYNLIPSLTARENVAKRPDVLLCDEPTGALDSTTGIRVLQVLQDINDELGTTTAVITHNAVIGKMADRVIRLADGRVQEVTDNPRRQSPSQLAW